MPNVIIVKEVIAVTVSKGTTETCVKTLTSVSVVISVMQGLNARTLTETILVAARKDTLEPALHAYAVNARTLSVLKNRSAFHREPKSANVKKAINSIVRLFVSTLTNVKTMFAVIELNVPTLLEVILVPKSQSQLR